LDASEINVEIPWNELSVWQMAVYGNEPITLSQSGAMNCLYAEKGLAVAGKGCAWHCHACHAGTAVSPADVSTGWPPMVLATAFS